MCPFTFRQSIHSFFPSLPGIPSLHRFPSTSSSKHHALFSPSSLPSLPCNPSPVSLPFQPRSLLFHMVFTFLLSLLFLPLTPSLCACFRLFLPPQVRRAVSAGTIYAAQGWNLSHWAQIRLEAASAGCYWTRAWTHVLVCTCTCIICVQTCVVHACV
jgi:hypothetical protein